MIEKKRDRYRRQYSHWIIMGSCISATFKPPLPENNPETQKKDLSRKRHRLPQSRFQGTRLKQLMIVGIDCYHDTAAGKRSIGALVASLNQSMSRWFSKCVLQSRGQEIIDGLKVPLKAALKAYWKYNNCLPSRNIEYRDGVGDGTLQSVVNYEVPQIMQSIKTMSEDYVPKLTVVVVKKRSASRFFARIDGKLSNPPPGTVIDTEVTRPEWYDFFIVSQAVRMGSICPTHYNVVFDSSGLKPDHMQRLTYKLCHMYYNWQAREHR
ncbi:hypothetical protein MHYP_G00349600 [Metynnis hypsauchen]